MEDTLNKQMEKYPHLREYIQSLKNRTSQVPKYFDKMTIKELQEIRQAAIRDPTEANVIYRAGEGFIHINALNNEYVSVERALSEHEKEKVKLIKEAILELSADEPPCETNDDLSRVIDKLFKESTKVVQNDGQVKKSLFSSKIPITQSEYDRLNKHIRRDVVGYGPIESLILDPYIEDIHLIGTDPVHIAHKAFQYALTTNVKFDDEQTLNDFLISLSERIGRPVSASKPIVDGTLPDGSRINIIYSNDISQKGSSFTIRKFTAEPISAVQLVKFGTFSAELAAYLWLCLEHKTNMMVSGETASGKTTSLNAILPFIDHRAKIYSAEDTPEVKPPQESWQRCVSREAGPEESRVTMFDLLKAALRSRPDYIVIGEIRGEDGRVAFQAMQTGIPVLATFHAASATKFIQRFTGDPIRVPITFIDNMNVLILQSAVNVKGKFLRRVTNIEEFIGYSQESGGVLTRNVFKWDPVSDKIVFRGNHNSYILEEKIALAHGFSDKREIYEELRKREQIIRKMVELNILGYKEVNTVLKTYYEQGEEALPFGI
jgi:flagellar protein FlaI